MGVRIPVGGVQIVLRWASSGDPEEMLSTIGATGRGPAGSAQELATNLQALTATNLTPASSMIVGWSFVGVRVYVQQDSDSAEVGESTVTVAGTSSAQSLPSNCAVLVRKRTAVAGRGGSGRMFIPPANINEQDVTNNGTINASSLTPYQTRVNSWFGAVNGYLDTDDLCLFHDLGGASGTEVLPGDVITGLVVDSQIATQRQRMRR